MNKAMKTGLKWSMMEFSVSTAQKIANPFWDVQTTAVMVCHETGMEQRVNGFYDGGDAYGEHVWKFRWTPEQIGQWQCRIISQPVIAGLSDEFAISIGEEQPGNRGFLRAYPERTWGFAFDNGDPFFLLGDTIYNFFGGHYCEVDMHKIIAHRKSQGVNYIRARMQVSPFHMPTRNTWQTKDCWPWKGSTQWPDFTGFNLDYFRSVDEAMAMMTELQVGMEIIFEAWMLEFPFNDRGKFLTEHEEHWIRYIVSRYAAYPCVYVWCPVNEYDLYPGKTDKSHMREANRWFKRLAALIKSCDPHKHPVGAHQWDQNIPLHERLGDCNDLDIYLVQSDWFKEIAVYDRDPSLCLWIEDQLRFHAPDRKKAALCSEFGYERAAEQFTIDVHNRMDEHHSRRGQWKAGFVGFPIVHGFNNTWGPNLTLDPDAIGARFLLPYYRFMTEEYPFQTMSPQQQLVESGQSMLDLSSPALCLANEDLSAIAVYFPVAGTCTLQVDSPVSYLYYWFDPRTGIQTEPAACSGSSFTSPGEAGDITESDWVLCLRRN